MPVLGSNTHWYDTLLLIPSAKLMDERVKNLDEKIKQCDAELLRYKSQMTGPSAASVRNRAMTVLKRKKMYEAQRDQIVSTQFNVDQASFAIEQLQTTKVAVDALKNGNELMKKQFQELNINDIENVTDDLEELLADSQEINEILSRSYAVGEGIDEGQLENELNALEEEVAMDRLHNKDVVNLPTYLPTPTAPPMHGNPSQQTEQPQQAQPQFANK